MTAKFWVGFQVQIVVIVLSDCVYKYLYIVSLKPLWLWLVTEDGDTAVKYLLNFTVERN